MENPKRGREGLALLLLFIWVLTLLMCRSIYQKTAEMTKGSLQYKYSLRLKSEAGPENGFRPGEIQELRKVLAQEEMAYCAFNKLTAAAEPYTRTAQVCGVGGDYHLLNSIKLKKGAFLAEEDFIRKNKVAVIENRLAQALFNSTDVVGMKIRILGNTFTVIGVAANDASIAGMLTETVLPRLYVPLSAIDGKETDFYITNLEIASSEALMDKAMFKEGIAVLGKNPEDFLIADYSEIVALAKQRSDFIFFIIGLYSICLIASFAVNKLKGMVSGIRREISSEYLRNVIKKRKRTLLTDSARVGAALAAIFLLWKSVSFNPYIQSDKLPNDPTSLTQFIQIIKASLRNFLTWDYVYMLHEQRVLSLLDKCGSVLFALCLICTVLLLVISRYGKGHPKREMARTAGILCLWFSIFVILSSAIILSLGMPIILSMKDIMLLMGSLFIILLAQDRVSGHMNENESASEYRN